jgi:acetyl esterase
MAEADAATTNPDDQQQQQVQVSPASRTYARLFLDHLPGPDTHPADALAMSRERCIKVARLVGGPLVNVRRIEELTLPSLGGGQFQVRVYLPTLFDEEEDGGGVAGGRTTTTTTTATTKVGMILYAHGGGMVMGCLPSYDSACRRLAVASGAAVVSVGYRLAPEHPYPAGLDDCEAAYRWMVSTLALDRYPGVLDPERMALVGDSAGGHMCAALAVRLQRRGGDLPPRLRPKAAVLVYPALDFTLTSASNEKYALCSQLTPAAMRMMLHAYLSTPGAPDNVRTELTKDPEVSVLFLPQEELAATIPPTLLLSAECDPIVDDAAAFEPRLRAAGVPVRRVVYPNVIHGFWSGWDLFPEAAEALEEACRWLREHGVGT